MQKLNTKKNLLLGVAGAIGLLAVILIGSVQVGATFTNTQIDKNISVTPTRLEFGTVFPEEVLYKKVHIALSQSFLASDALDDVEYHIEQKIKPKNGPVDAQYCQQNPTDFTRCYPTLCPYLSKEVDVENGNDKGVPAFHDPNASSSIAYGRLAKSDSDIEDKWTIDLHVPCFQGMCAQDDVVPKDYELDPQFEGVDLGCNLSVIVDRVSLSKKGRIIIQKKTLNYPGVFQFTGTLNPFSLATTPWQWNYYVASTSFSNLDSGTYLVTEATSSDWQLHTIQCVESGTQNTTVANKTATIKLEGGELVWCTFYNEIKNYPTRTQGFWQTHTAFASKMLGLKFPSGMIIGTSSHTRLVTNIQANGQSRLFGAYYSSIPKKTNNQNRSALEKARMQLLQQLVTMKINCATFGCAFPTYLTMSQADSAYAGTNVSAILAVHTRVEAYNKRGDWMPFPVGLGSFGSATPATSKNWANKIFWDTP